MNFTAKNAEDTKKLTSRISLRSLCSLRLKMRLRLGRFWLVQTE
jgi:hypothetical protein